MGVYSALVPYAGLSVYILQLVQSPPEVSSAHSQKYGYGKPTQQTSPCSRPSRSVAGSGRPASIAESVRRGRSAAYLMSVNGVGPPRRASQRTMSIRNGMVGLKIDAGRAGSGETILAQLGPSAPAKSFFLLHGFR